MILIREIQTGEQIAAAFWGQVWFLNYQKYDFSKDGKSIHIINSTGEKATIRTIDFKSCREYKWLKFLSKFRQISLDKTTNYRIS